MVQRVTFRCQGATSQVEGTWFVVGECWLGPIQVGDGFQFALDADGVELPVDLVVSSIVSDDGSDTDHLTPGASGRLHLTGHEPSRDVSGLLLGGAVERP